MDQQNVAMDRISSAAVVVLLSSVGVVGEVAKLSTVLQKFDGMLHNSSDAEIASTFRGQSSDERKAGKQAPVIEGLLAQGWKLSSAKSRVAKMATIAKAYLPFNGARWEVPKDVGDIEIAVELARKELKRRTGLKVLDKHETAEAIAIIKEQRRVAAEQGIKVADLSQDEKDAAAEQALEAIDKVAGTKKVNTAAEKAFQAVGPTLVPQLIDKLRSMLNDHDMAQMQEQQAQREAGVNAAEQVQATKDAALHAPEREQHAA